MNTNSIPTDATDDDLRAMGLPPAFTFDELKATFEDEEIAQMAEDGLVELPEDFKAPAKTERASDTINRRADNGEDADDDADTDAASDGDGEVGTDAGDNTDGGEAKTETAAEDVAGDGDAVNNDDNAGAGEGEQDKNPEPDPEISLRDDTEAKKKVEAYDDKLTEIQDSYDGGDMTEADFRAKIKELNAEHIAAQRELDEIDRHNTEQRTAYANIWYDKVATFMQDNPGLSEQTPVPGLSGASALQVFDQALRHVTSDERFGHLSMDEKISAAAEIADAYAEKNASRKLRQEEPKPKVEDDPVPEPKKDVADSDPPSKTGGPRNDPRPDPVQTLGTVSSATDAEIEDGRFAAIDRADALEAERLISKLTDAEREAYLRGA